MNALISLAANDNVANRARRIRYFLDSDEAVREFCPCMRPAHADDDNDAFVATAALAYVSRDIQEVA